MKTGWKTLIVASVVLAALSSQVMAQPWSGGPGRGQGAGRGGPGPRGQQWGPQDGRGAGQGGAGAWCPLGMERGAMRGLLGRRLNLTPEQREGIQNIVQKAQSRVHAAIKEILTEEQLAQLQQMRDRAGQANRSMQGPGAGMRGGRMGPQGQGPGPRGPMDGRGEGRGGRMGPGGQGWDRPVGGRGQGWDGPMGGRGQGMGGRGGLNWGPPMGRGMQQPPAQSFEDGRGVGRRGQGMGPQEPSAQAFEGGRGAGRRGQGMGPGMPRPGAGMFEDGPDAGRRGQGMGPGPQNGAPMLDRLFDRADANNDGALTREELKAFQDAMRGSEQPRQ